MFFEAFVSDVKQIAHLIALKKRMMGIVDMDTVSSLDDDFNEQSYSGSKEDFDLDLVN